MVLWFFKKKKRPTGLAARFGRDMHASDVAPMTNAVARG